MADVTSPTSPAPATDTVTDDAPAARPVEVDVLDDLVEDVSIDGMCGVY
jgi:mycofactocin precursor